MGSSNESRFTPNKQLAKEIASSIRAELVAKLPTANEIYERFDPKRTITIQREYSMNPKKRPSLQCPAYVGRDHYKKIKKELEQRVRKEGGILYGASDFSQESEEKHFVYTETREIRAYAEVELKYAQDVTKLVSVVNITIKMHPESGLLSVIGGIMEKAGSIFVPGNRTMYAVNFIREKNAVGIREESGDFLRIE